MQPTPVGVKAKAIGTVESQLLLRSAQSRHLQQAAPYLHFGCTAVAAAQPLLVLLKSAMEGLHSPAFNLPEFINSGGDEVLVMADHQHATLEGC